MDRRAVFSDIFWRIWIHEEGAEMPASAERSVLTEVGRAMPDSTRGCAFVFAGTGFKASAARSVLTGMQLLAKRPYPVKFFGTVEQAAAWSAAETGSKIGRLWKVNGAFIWYSVISGRQETCGQTGAPASWNFAHASRTGLTRATSAT